MGGGLIAVENLGAPQNQRFWSKEILNVSMIIMMIKKNVNGF